VARQPFLGQGQEVAVEDGLLVVALSDRVHQIRRLLVLDASSRLVGIVAMADLAVDAGTEARPAATLREVSEPAEPRR
jgi:CBS-domain-containing membrane protein